MQVEDVKNSVTIENVRIKGKKDKDNDTSIETEP